MDKRKETTLRFVAIATSCIGMTTAGTLHSIWAYAYSLKKHFNYTQPTVEAIVSVSNLGISMGFPAGLLCERIGSQWTSLVAFFFNVGGYLMLYGTTLKPRFYHHHPWLQYMYFFIAGMGSACTYMACLRTGISNVSPRHRAMGVAIFDGCLLCGPIIFSAIYGTIFAAGHTYDEEHQNLGGYYMTVAIVFVVVGILCIIFLKEYPITKHDSESTSLLSSSEETIYNEENEIKNDSTDDKTICRRLLSLDFHYILWTFLFTSGVQVLIQNNQSIYLKSFHLEAYTVVLVTMSPAPGIVGEIAVGIVSDAFLDKIPRSAYLLGVNIIQTIVLVISIFHSDKLVFFTIMDIVNGCGNGITWCLISTIVSEHYGIKCFAGNWGLFLFGYGIITLLLQETFGWIYENNITDVASTDCFGVHCFSWSFVMCATVIFCATVFSLATFQNDLKDRKTVKYTPLELIEANQMPK